MLRASIRPNNVSNHSPPIAGSEDGWRDGGIPSASILLSVRVRTVINDLRPPSAGSHGNREYPSRSARPPSFGLCSRDSGPVPQSLSPCDQIGPLRRASLHFLFFRFVFTLTFRACLSSLSPSFRWRRPRSADSFDLDYGGGAAWGLGPLTRSTSQAFANWPVAKAERERETTGAASTLPTWRLPTSSARRQDGLSLQS